MRPQCIQSFAHRDIVQIFPVDTWRNENVIVTSKQCVSAHIWALWRHNDVIIASYAHCVAAIWGGN